MSTAPKNSTSTRAFSLASATALSFLLVGCNTVTVQERVLSTNQRVAMVSSPGDGVSPPTNVVLLERRKGLYDPVSAGYAAAPITSALAGVGAGVAIGIGNYAGARALRPSTTSVVQTGANATGGAGGSASGGAGGSGFGGAGGAGGSAVNTNTNSNTSTGGTAINTNSNSNVSTSY